MVSFSSMIAHLTADVIYVKFLSPTPAVNTTADGQQVRDDRCSLCANVWTGLYVTC